ncbi:MAG: hypothetical protein BWY87_01350 [Deltaproteobacteria bacterium ADurb.Bin510]|nr:MAG: hypothetical protein BWY87_01350 [Deltaproteobacteria bacterium ADurb.Bin510]
MRRGVVEADLADAAALARIRQIVDRPVDPVDGAVAAQHGHEPQARRERPAQARAQVAAAGLFKLVGPQATAGTQIPVVEVVAPVLGLQQQVEALAQAVTQPQFQTVAVEIVLRIGAVVVARTARAQAAGQPPADGVVGRGVQAAHAVTAEPQTGILDAFALILVAPVSAQVQAQPRAGPVAVAGVIALVAGVELAVLGILELLAPGPQLEVAAGGPFTSLEAVAQGRIAVRNLAAVAVVEVEPQGALVTRPAAALVIGEDVVAAAVAQADLGRELDSRGLERQQQAESHSQADQPPRARPGVRVSHGRTLPSQPN